MPNEIESASSHKLSLAKELLDDIELGRLIPENLLLKTIRLARLIEDQETRLWLGYELSGFRTGDPVSLEYMDLTGRWVNKEKKLGYWQSLAQIDAQISTSKLQIQQLNIPNVTFAPSSSNPYEVVSLNVASTTEPIKQVLQNLTDLNSAIARLSAIRSRVLALIHAFVSRTYYELAFSGLQETIFERHKAIIDVQLADSCGTILEKVPAIYDRLAQGDPEAISQALNTCRRVIDAFADAISPPTDETINIGGNELQLTAKHHQNRINAFIHENCASQSRRQRLRHCLGDLYDRVSAGIHDDIKPVEAQFLFLQTYMLIGEILSLRKKSD
jgi:hypothetical protein